MAESAPLETYQNIPRAAAGFFRHAAVNEMDVSAGGDDPYGGADKMLSGWITGSCSSRRARQKIFHTGHHLSYAALSHNAVYN